MIIDWTKGSISQNAGFYGLGLILNWAGSTFLAPPLVGRFISQDGIKFTNEDSGKFVSEVGGKLITEE